VRHFLVCGGDGYVWHTVGRRNSQAHVAAQHSSGVGYA
jgi:hypothetical protein